ncbi:MAG: AsnC family transcriptional regulator [Chloroflexi bacterium UTCFX4]|jgi:Lrp/AsnC family leucine-responsive transcriptional regulator|nr:MAG: AsnC family transcriptional regulator [Chloroflexi bacterium UTCFX4]
MIDKIDAKLLDIIQRDARLSNVTLAARVGLTKTAVFERIRKMEAAGIIQTYVARLNPKKIGRGLVAFVFVRAEEQFASQQAGKALARIPEVLEVHNIAGEDCYLVKVRVRDTDALGRLLRNKFGKIKSIRSTRTTIALDTLKESGWLPIAPISEKSDEA